MAADGVGPVARDAVLLPEFCGERAALILVLGAELVAISLAAAGAYSWIGFFSRLAWFSLLVQWIALMAAALLCAMRSRLAGLRPVVAISVTIAVPVLVTVVVSELAWRGIAYAELSLDLRLGSHASFVTRNATLAAIVSFVAMHYLALQQRWRREVEAEAAARIDALTARIHPHFLFNTLNTALALVRDQPQRAEQVLEDLADLFRAALKDGRALGPLGTELALARTYLDIESLRLGARLQVRWDVADLPADALAPHLWLQPLVENAVFHGIELLPEGGELTVSGGQESGRVWVLIENPRPVQDPRGPAGRGGQLALDNVRQRFALAFGTSAEFSIQTQPTSFRVEVRFPLRTT